MKKIILLFLLSVANIAHGMKMNDDNVTIQPHQNKKFYLIWCSSALQDEVQIADITNSPLYADDIQWAVENQSPSFNIGILNIFILRAKDSFVSRVVEKKLDTIQEFITQEELKKAPQNKKQVKIKQQDDEYDFLYDDCYKNIQHKN
ncbi:MAG: hypothetical protein Q8Q60_00295 [Candidatus Chromulinivorax sp.]|nr:hypothetical protein [Candidatus Chromulinivorax sp.]